MIVRLLNKRTPIFQSDDCLFNIMLDTGAFMSVFVGKEGLFHNSFKDAFYSGYDTIISGFGGNGSICPVYVIPKFCIRTLTITNLPVAIQENKLTSVDLVLSSYIFKNNPFTIDYNKRELSISDNEIHCKFNLHTVKDIIDGFTVFTQE